MWGLFRRSAITFLILAPFVVRAEGIIFVDIMYDPPGSDTGAEWVRVQNTSGAPIDMSRWRFVEGGTNHKLIALGVSIVPQNGFAVIAADAATYSAEHAGTTDIIFDSSFSLSNTGELIALKNASSTVIAQTSYTAPLPPPVPPKVSQDKPSSKTSKKNTTSKKSPTFTSTAASSVANPIVALPRTESSWSWWPWAAGVGVLVAGSIGVLFLVPKPSKSGYEIIDTSDK
jgi:hypothetical protein